MNSINWSKQAFKQLRKLDMQHQPILVKAVRDLEAMPHCKNVKSLTNHSSAYRLRVGNFRIMFDWDGEIKVVEIQEIRKRDERTY